MIVLSAFVAVLLFLAAAVLVWSRFNQQTRRVRAADTQLCTYHRFIDHLRESAWDHRDVDPFAAIVLDEIRSFTNQQSEITP